MGWDYCSAWTNKQKVVDSLKTSIEKSGWKILDEKKTTEGVWFAVDNGKERFIYFGLIKKAGGEYGLKTLDESAQPFYYSCPTKFFNIVPEVAPEWRKKVIEINEKGKLELSIGMKVKLYGERYTIVQRYELGRGKNFVVANDQGQRFRLKRNQIKEIEVINE